MIIALFSDIHANLPALEAFFKDVDVRKPDATYCLGDLVGYNIWPNEVINEIRKRKSAHNRLRLSIDIRCPCLSGTHRSHLTHPRPA